MLDQVLFSLLYALVQTNLVTIFGLLLGFGLSLIFLYFVSDQFRRVYNLWNPPRGRQAAYGRNGKVYRSGWAYDEDDNRWRYVSRDDEVEGYSYTRYRRPSEDDDE